MNTIPPIFWMIIVGVLTIMVCLILYYFAMLLKETKNTVSDARETMKQANKVLQQAEIVVNDVQRSITVIRGTVEEANQAIIVPIRKIAGGILVASSFFSNLRKNKEETKE